MSRFGFPGPKPKNPEWYGLGWDRNPVEYPPEDNGRNWFLRLIVGQRKATVGAVSHKALQQLADRKYGGNIEKALEEYERKFSRD